MFQDPWPERQSRIQAIALFVLPTLFAGAIGYRYLTTATPISATEAVDVFRADKTETRTRPSTGSTGSQRRLAAARTRRDRSATSQRRAPATSGDRMKGTRVAAASSRPEKQQRRATGAGSGASEQRTEARWQPGMPKEGAYTWDTEGYESFNGARRRFPEETHRIVTHEGRGTWMNHHVFSKEREAWTRTRATRDGYFTTYARNRIVFGPVTRDAEVYFDPPMLNNPMTGVGARWSGEWDGKTYGTYAGRIVDEGSMEIEGEKVEVVELELEMEMHGEVEGTSVMRFWVSGEHHMVVREHYKQDVSSGGAEYHAEWDMTVKSLTPRR